ncbi:MAG: bifunctional diaminohydroxyphosphoribosylaminopyrimidine deaminase/5-amino-6-(5-phosphoribosylamino)uracil reductase RibD [Candidatus Marinimicrobia bacterium]|nr:bifunctional diaminohydroxyphosphoribosylaminopyrimidine deaminase/5-amino-6-(5-phosphoribosylamino)uracil reductase RibD [Candidatus Neomarinimicrobiota bacterium]
MDDDKKMMSYALSVAEKGLLWTSPNPMVGAIIVANGKIISEGYHEKYGEAHAEINAFKNLDKLPEDAAMYVTLEPCSIQGKTPPCTEAILEKGIKKIYAAMEDPNPKVSGSGIDILSKAGIDIRVGLMEGKAKKLNERYIKYITEGVPWVTLKAAQTLDGRIADINGNSKWITSEASRKEVHRLRASHDAVLVGAGTIVKDNPRLDVRYVNGKQPVKVIIDENLDSDVDSNVYNDKDGKTIIFTAVDKNNDKAAVFAGKGIEIITFDKSAGLDIEWLLSELGAKGISSLLVEGGSKIFSSFLNSGKVDRYIIFINSSFMGSGIETFQSEGFPIEERLKLSDLSVEVLGEDIMLQGIPRVME